MLVIYFITFSFQTDEAVSINLDVPDLQPKQVSVKLTVYFSIAYEKLSG